MPRTKQPGRDRDAKGRAKPLQGPTKETAQKHLERAHALHIPGIKRVEQEIRSGKTGEVTGTEILYEQHGGIEAGYAETTFGVLYARGMISVNQYEMCRELKNLHSILFGSGNARCSSVESGSRGLPNDHESKKMRERWAAYKHVMSGIVKGERDLFEHVVLRNAYREWMRFTDSNLFVSANKGGMHLSSVDDGVAGLRGSTATYSPDSFPSDPDNEFRSSAGTVGIKAKVRELRIILRVIHTLYERLPREIKELRTNGGTGYVAISQAQKNALDGDQTLLDKLYAKGES